MIAKYEQTIQVSATGDPNNPLCISICDTRYNISSTILLDSEQTHVFMHYFHAMEAAQGRYSFYVGQHHEFEYPEIED